MTQAAEQQQQPQPVAMTQHMMTIVQQANTIALQSERLAEAFAMNQQLAQLAQQQAASLEAANKEIERLKVGGGAASPAAPAPAPAPAAETVTPITRKRKAIAKR